MEQRDFSPFLVPGFQINRNFPETILVRLHLRQSSVIVHYKGRLQSEAARGVWRHQVGTACAPQGGRYGKNIGLHIEQLIHTGPCATGASDWQVLELNLQVLSSKMGIVHRGWNSPFHEVKDLVEKTTQHPVLNMCKHTTSRKQRMTVPLHPD